MLKKIIFPIALVALIAIFSFKSANHKSPAKSENLVWHTNVKEAMDLANKENKPLFLFFTGSDWCGWCIRLQKEVFKTPEFEAWAKEKVVLVELDFPRRSTQTDEVKMQNAQLQQVFAVRGYPTVWFAKAEEKEGKINFQQLGSTGYLPGGPSAWLATANDIVAKYTHSPKATPEKKTATKNKKAAQK